MEYNKNRFSKINDKKLLHKVKKQWIVISSALLLAIGGSALHTINIHADTNNSNKSVSQNITNQFNNKSHSHSAISTKPSTNSSVDRQASLLHQRIIANQISSKNYVHNLNNEFKSSYQKNVGSITNQNNDRTLKKNNTNSINKAPVLTTKENKSNLRHTIQIPSSEVETSNSNNINAFSDNSGIKNGLKDQAWSNNSSAKWDLYNDNTLYIHDGKMNTNQWPSYFSNDNYRNEAQIYKIVCRNVTAPRNSEGLFGHAGWPSSTASQHGANFKNLKIIDVSGLDTSDVSDMGEMFSYSDMPDDNQPNAGLHQIIGLNHLNTSNATDMNNMFGIQNSLPYLDLSSFDTRKALAQSHDSHSWAGVINGLFHFFPGAQTTHIKFGPNAIFDNNSGMNASSSWFNDTTGKVYSGMPFEDKHSHQGNWFNTANSAHGKWNQADWLQDNNGDLFLFNGNNVNGGAELDDSPNKHGINWSNVQHVYTHDVKTSNECSHMFSNLHSLETFDGSGLDVSNAHDMGNMFNSDYNLTSLSGLGNWNTRNVRYMEAMFQSDFKLTNLKGLSDWNVSGVSSTFYGFQSDFLDDKNLKDITALKNWNINNKPMVHMFEGDNKLQVMDVGNNLHLKSVNIPGSWENNQDQIVDVNNNPQPGFYYNTDDSTLINLDYYDWRTGQLIGAQQNVSVPKNWTISRNIMQPNINYQNNKTYYRLADDGDNNDPITHNNDYLPTLNTGSMPRTFNIPVIPNDVTHYGYWGHAHYEFTNNGTLYIFNGNMDSEALPPIFEQSDGSGKYEPGPGWASGHKMAIGDHIYHIKTSNVVAPSYCGGMFAGDTGGNRFNYVRDIDLSGMNASNINNMTGFFHGCWDLTNVNFGNNFDTSHVTTMNSMFDDDTKIISLNLPFNTKSVNNFVQMFWDTPSLQSIDLSTFNITPQDNTTGMFDISLASQGGRISSALKDITLGSNVYLQGTKFAPWYDSTSNNSGLSDNNLEITGPWINADKGTTISDVKDLNHNRNPGSWINIRDVKKYKLNFVNQLTGSDVGNHTVYIRGDKKATFLPIDNSILPNGYKIVPNCGNTIPLASNQTNVTVPVFNPNNMITYGVWGSANYYLTNNGELELTNGDMQINSAPQDLRNHANQVRKISTYSVRAPSNSSDVFSGNYNGFHNLTNFDFSHGFDTSSTTNMNGMFSNLSIKDLNLNDLNTSDASTMSNMFANDNNLQTLAINGFAMGEHGVTNTQNMFSNDNKIESMAIGNSTIFQPNSALNNGNHWIDNKRNQYNLLDGTPHNAGIYYNYNNNDKNDFHTIHINYMFGSKNVGNNSDVFLNPKHTINKLDIPNINDYALDPDDPSQFPINDNQVNVPVDMAGTWGQAQWLLNTSGRFLLQNGDLDTNQWQGPNKSYIKSIITNNVIAPDKMSDIFRGLPNDTLINLSGIRGLNNVQDFRFMMSYDPSLSQVEGINNFTTGQNADIEHMFDMDKKLQSINLSGMDTSKVSNMSHMFESDYALHNISDLNNLDTGNVSDMSWMFCNDHLLTTLNPSSLITDHTKTIASMFYGDNNIKTLDLSHADTSGINDMNMAFTNMSGLNKIILNHKTNLNNSSGLTGHWLAPQYQYKAPFNIPQILDQPGITNLGSDNITTWYKTGLGNIYYINQNIETIGGGRIWRTPSDKLIAPRIPNGYFEDGGQYISDIQDGKRYYIYITGEKANLHVIFRDGLKQVSDYHLNGTNDIGDTVQLSKVPIGYTVSDPTRLQYRFDSDKIATPPADSPTSNDYRTVNTMYDDVILVNGDNAIVNINYINDSDGKNLFSYQDTGQIGESDTLDNIPKGYALDDTNENNYKFLVSNIKTHHSNDDLMNDDNVYVHKSNHVGILHVVYLNQNNNRVGQVSAINGRIGDKVNVTNKSIGGVPIPSDYALDSDENPNNVITSPNSTIYLRVHGLKISTNVKVIRVLENSGKSSMSDTFTTVSGNNGDTTSLSAYAKGLTPSNYNVDTSHTTFAPILINKHRTPVVVFYYQAKQQVGAPITVNYINHGQLIKQAIISGGFIGSNQANGKTVSSDIKDSVPANYSLNNSVNDYHFDKYSQNIDLDITGKSVSNTFLVHRILTDGHHMTNSNVFVELNSHVGSDITINPYLTNNNTFTINGSSSLIPQGYHPEKSNNLHLKVGYDRIPQINYVYHKNYQPNPMKTIRIHYINTSDNSEVDEESDQGTVSDSFSIKPYTEDIPEIVNNHYNSNDSSIYDKSGHVISYPINFNFNKYNNSNSNSLDVYIHVNHTPSNNLIILSNN